MHVTACFSQMGGLRGLLPVLENTTDWQVKWYGREPVLRYLRDRGFPARHLSDLRIHHADEAVLLTDTINLSRTDDGLLCREAWREAASAGVPSVAFVDSWWGYRERFAVAGEDLRNVFMPDVVAVVDQIAYGDMAELGFPREKVRILGSPWLASLSKESNPTDMDRKETLSRYGIDGDEVVLAFVSQPLSRILNDRESWGFTERDVIPALLRACESLPGGIRERLRLLVLAHPEEEKQELAYLVEKTRPCFRTDVRKEADPLALLRASDAVTGIFSILLVEAALVGLPVLSIQPNLRREDMLVTNRTGATLAIRDSTELPSAIYRLLCDENFRAERIKRQKTFQIVSDAVFHWRRLLHELSVRESLQRVRHS